MFSGGIFKHKNVKDHPINKNIPGISTDMIAIPLKSCDKPRVAGPDGLAVLHLKEPELWDIQYHIHFSTLSIQSANSLSIWKKATFIWIIDLNHQTEVTRKKATQILATR